jgi:hypothetical protein
MRQLTTAALAPSFSALPRSLPPRRARGLGRVNGRGHDPPRRTARAAALRTARSELVFAQSQASGWRGPARSLFRRPDASQRVIVLATADSSAVPAPRERFATEASTGLTPPARVGWDDLLLANCFFVSAMLERHRVVAPLSWFATR